MRPVCFEQNAKVAPEHYFNPMFRQNSRAKHFKVKWTGKMVMPGDAGGRRRRY
jgi:hypothetical protein